MTRRTSSPTCSRRPRPSTSLDLDREADRLGELLGGRVTFVADDGRVVGDSTQTEAELGSLENHLSRPEVVAAREQGFGSSQRYSGTISTDMLYVAVRASHPVVAYVRLALPLTDVDAQLAAIVQATRSGAMAVSIPLALLVSWLVSAVARTTRQRHRARGGALFRRRPHAPDVRPRQRRARNRGPCARFVGPAARRPNRRALARSRAHGSDSQRHGRGRTRRGSGRAACSWSIAPLSRCCASSLQRPGGRISRSSGIPTSRPS